MYVCVCVGCVRFRRFSNGVRWSVLCSSNKFLVCRCCSIPRQSCGSCAIVLSMAFVHVLTCVGVCSTRVIDLSMVIVACSTVSIACSMVVSACPIRLYEV